MMTIHKYQLLVVESQMIHIHADAEILAVQSQRDTMCIWARVDTDKEKILRHIHVYGTGAPCGGSYHMDYIGTVQHQGCVWHVFAEGKPL